MGATKKTINTFSTRVRQMILQYRDLKQENEGLYAMVDERDAKIKQLEAQLARAQNDYGMLKMAKMLEVTDGDLEEAKKRVAGLVRDVNKCITLLSGK
jgi:predicted nuclease with TOPRIM domain